jgi:uncharacterized protein YqjF (DUF2071 family)
MRRPWVMAQTWKDLLFAHWSVPVSALRRVVPSELPLDTFEGRGWISVTPFEVVGLRLHGLPPLPGLSSFPELNVRTYVSVGGRPGIYFFSLDAGSRLAVAAARRAYRLPYFRAEMSIARDGARVSYESRRTQDDAPPAELSARYAPAGEPFQAVPGSIEHWLAERYCLYTVDERHRVYRGDIHHPPWTLRPARATFARNTMADEVGIRLDGEPLLHFAERKDVVFWPLSRVPAPARSRLTWGRSGSSRALRDRRVRRRRHPLRPARPSP